jgi:endonuclease YncB( thermonuclease family)
MKIGIVQIFLFLNSKIRSLFYQGWFRRNSFINEEIISRGFATAKHLPTLSHVKAYNLLIERLVKAEVKAVKKKSGIWKDDVNDGIFYRTWSWLKKKVFRR